MESRTASSGNASISFFATVVFPLPVPPQIPPLLTRWYTAREIYVAKVDPEYGIAFSDRLAREMKKDFLAMAPLYRTLRGICDEL